MKNANILAMKKDLEQILGIEVWSPTEEQLNSIWSKLATLPNNANENDILKVVSSVYHKPLIVSCMEGLDTSVAKMALFKIKEMQDNIKAVEKQNATKNNSTAGKG